MKLGDFLEKDFVLQELASEGKRAVLEELIAPLSEKYSDLDTDQAVRVLLEREELGTTALGDGIAIPHGKLEELNEVVVIVGRSLQGIDFGARDSEPCTIFFLVLAPANVAGMHLRALAQISRVLKNPVFRQQFMDAEGLENLWQLMQSV